MSYNLSVELLNAIIAYLGTRPFKEVANLINAIDSEVKSQVKEEVKETKKEDKKEKTKSE